MHDRLAPSLTLAPVAEVEITRDAPDLAAALAAACETEGIAARLVDAPSGRSPAVSTAAASVLDPAEAQWRALAHAQTCRKAGGQRLVLLEDSAPEDGFWRAGMAGLARTARREWPDMNIISFDASRGRLDQVVAALGAPAGDYRVGGDGRLIETALGGVPLKIDASTADPDQLWLVTGGARGVTARCAVELARRGARRFALLGRSDPAPWPEGVPDTDDLGALRAALARQTQAVGEKAKPAEIDAAVRRALAGRDIRATLAALHAEGAEADYVQADLMSRRSTAAAIEHIRRRFGAVTGLVHGAGVLADRLILDKTRDQFDRVFHTKVTGLKTLLDALDPGALRHAAFFSSAAARFGNAGQADYAMANQTLNQAARALKTAHPHIQVKSFGWGPWAGGMVDASLARKFEAMGVALIELDQGAAVFADHLLGGAAEDVELLVGEPWDAS